MIIAIRKEPNGSIYLDKNLRQDIDYTQPPYNFTLINVEKEDCESSDFNDDLTFSIDKYNARKQGYINQKTLADLQNWFNTDYTTYEQMLTRRAYLGIDDEIVDEFRNKTYKSLKDLYEEAESVAVEIKNLRKVD